MSPPRPGGPARAIADLIDGLILARVDVGASPERVFRALTEGRDVLAWWGSPETYRVTEWHSDLRVGGRWRSRGVGADGAPFEVVGEYLVIDAPVRLVQTWKADWDPGAVTTLRYQLDAIPGGTRITVRHEGFAGRAAACEGHADGWERVLGWLATYLAGAA
jgi:uncharacterized protein YndB with AHSA1/START domain